MNYNIRLTITHSYERPAANGRHLIRVLPKSIAGRQQLSNHLLEVFPEAETRTDSVDFFGNRTTTCTHITPHDDMSIRLACHVEMHPPPPWRDVSPDAETVCQQWQASRDLGPESPVHFLGPTLRLPPNADIAAFARDLHDPSASAASTVITIGQALYEKMAFDASATTVDTSAAEAFKIKRGVCQDFSHIMISALQALGIPAAYVSGYLRTLPPEGGVKLAGADAMHAWVRAWCGTEMGWIEYDPTNATLVSTDHIVVGYGRDYSDISPVSGHLRSSGSQRNTQAVDVTLL
ncbi:transglutaminase family protein [Pelagimonas varians]|uniref:Transglutaminase-like superfamily protein n=1 Tax=Pelagimonas varians TaxID=696760 RepID=A0A238JXU4_9RHOB|nr:transglutaminase family protein [Pelagimonas varians]PYG33021.1 transglutaminase-like putative cysteine protease [Pelagimonas varians]SMX35478.1 Transglutaminase-like superfamily protein [Pelagimonas varians]